MDNNSEVVSLYLDDIIPNRFQPREVFDEQALKELAVSIKEHGVIQPIIVRKVENKYEIIAGERRYKASTMAGLTKIPAIVKNLDDKESSKIALIENLQRKDLTPIEEARTYQKILELEDGKMTQEALAATMGKTQSFVSNKLRLLALPEEVQDALLKEKISERHARSLLNVEDRNLQIKLLDKIIVDRMTVRDLDKEIRELKEGKTEGGASDMDLDIKIDLSSENKSNDEAGKGLLGSVDEVKDQKAASFGGSWTLQDNSADLKTEETATTAPTFNFAPLSSSETPTTPATTPETSAPQTFNLASFSNNEAPTTPTTAASQITTFTLGEKKEEINKDDLFSANKEQKTSDFSFVPNLDLDSSSAEVKTDAPVGETSTNTNTEEKKEPNLLVSGFDDMFSANGNVEKPSTGTQGTNVASTINTSGITVSNKKDVSKAVNDIKNTIKSLETAGFKVVVDEQDNDVDYKITITLGKDA